MVATKYTYSVANDTFNGAVSIESLTLEIQDSAIVTALDYINSTLDVLDIWFKDTLSSGDQTALTTLVGAHDGIPPASPTTKDGKPIVHLDAPTENDGKPVVVISPSTEGWMTWFTGAGDDDAYGTRGEGTKLRLTFTGPDSAGKECTINFIEPVELHDGQLFYQPSEWNPDDRWDFFVRMPATTVTPNGTTTGNCNIVDLGSYNLIVPAAGDGYHDISLSQAVPIPSSQGYWDVDSRTGAVTPSATPGAAKWNLLDVQIESFFMKNMPMGNPLGTFNIDTYKAEWISDRWDIVLKVYRNTAGAGTFDIGAWLMLFREYAI